MVELNRDQYKEELKSSETILKEMFILADAQLKCCRPIAYSDA